MKKALICIGLLVAFLNGFDGFATSYGLSHNIVEELNPIMYSLIQISPFLFLCLKIGLSIFIFYVTFLVYQKSKPTFQKLYLASLVAVCFLYTGIFGMHIFWLTSL